MGVVRWPIRRVRGGRQGEAVAVAGPAGQDPIQQQPQLQQENGNDAVNQAQAAGPNTVAAPNNAVPVAAAPRPSFLQNMQMLVWTFISTLIPNNE